MYNVPEHANNEFYMIQGMEPNMHFAAPFEQDDAMYNEGATGYVVGPAGMYYPAPDNYGYYSTGFEPPALDGLDGQYMGAQNVYYPPGYGYAQTSYNPFNQYIPGAVIGDDGQQYYTIPSYQPSVSAPAYAPYVQPDFNPNSSANSLYDNGSLINRTGGGGLNYNVNSTRGAFSNTYKSSSNQTSSLNRLLERPTGSVGPNKQAVTLGSVPAGRSPTPAYQIRSVSGSVPAVDKLSNGEVFPHHNQLKVAIPVGNRLSDSNPRHVGRALADLHGNVEQSSEQNCGPRTNGLKTELAVKAYTTKAGDTDVQGNIVIRADQYNKENLPVDYTHAKFFVIKSYSEDDVHKSVKYNVWSSTHHGNKKLNSAYEDAQRIAAGNPRGCPIFLFFSVNASGHFCGMAEMVGTVDFKKDMDFWQQDKWSGSFPVIWHFVKDVPNTSVRHIRLENNENKPVTNSRDTQEIMFTKGLEMLKIFKDHTVKTSLLDDFMYYEDRQKVMQDERRKYIVRNFGSPLSATALGPPCKLTPIHELPHSKEEKDIKPNDSSYAEKSLVSASEQVSSKLDVKNASSRGDKSEKNTHEAEDETVAAIKIGSLTIGPKHGEHESTSGVAPAARKVDVVTVGSIPVRLNSAEPLGTLTIGTILVDLKALKLEKGGSLN